MNLYVNVNWYNRYGSESLIAGFLLRNTNDFGSAISELTVNLHFPHPGPPRKTLEIIYAEFHKNRELLPKIAFQRARGVVEIDVASELIDGSNWKTEQRQFSLLNFQKVVKEVINALQLLRQQITPKDDFDLERFLQHCQSTITYLPMTDEDLFALKQDVQQARAVRLDAMSPWESLGIDWRDFHPDARKLLDDPFYWESADDFAPHGNNTGADLFAAYRSWFKRNAEGDSLVFLQKLYREWGCGDTVDQKIADEAVIALAFAELKLRAECRSNIAKLALEVIERQRRQTIEATEWLHREERLKRLEMLSSKLV